MKYSFTKLATAPLEDELFAPSSLRATASLRTTTRPSTEGRRWIPAPLWPLLAVFCAIVMPPEARAQSDYTVRTGTEFYFPHLVGEGFSSLNPSELRFQETGAGKRFLAATYGEARAKRLFFVDLGVEIGEPCLKALLGTGVCDVPEEPIYLGGALIEPVVLTHELQIVLHPELYIQGSPAKNWDLSAYFASRINLINRTEIQPEVVGRLTAVHSSFAGLMPLKLGGFLGPDFEAVGVTSSGLTMGAFALLSQNTQTYSRAALRRTWWLSSDPFLDLLRLDLAQVMTFHQRRITAQLGGMLDLRTVSYERYEEKFYATPPQRYYVDLGLKASMVAALPYSLKLGLNGQFFPYHAPDPELVRWYRSVDPQAGLILNRRVSVLDLTAAYTLRWVPPHPDFVSDFQDDGWFLIPGSTGVHYFSFTVGLRL